LVRFFPRAHRGKEIPTDDGRPLASELKLLQPLDRLALIGNDLRLPDKGDGHEAHGDDAKNENQPNVGLLNGKTKDASKPSHGKGSPSTGLLTQAIRFDRLRGHLNLPLESVAIERP